jgi:dipeptidyl aminopeptidase/acylaminoacyl peptidase
MLFRCCALALLVTLSAAHPAAARARRFSLDDYFRIVSVSDPQLSPDGRQIVIVVGRPDRTKDRTLHELVVVDPHTGAQRIITHERAEVSDPRWSPEGKALAFIDVAGSGDAAKPQVWVMPMNGGDARPVTTAKNGVEAYAWRPDGKAIAYVSREDARKEQHDDLFTVGDDSYLTRAAPVSAHIWVQTIGGATERITDGEWSVFPDNISWSADGKYIAFTWERDARYDSLFHARVSIVDVATKRVTDVSGGRWSWQPSFAPRGERLAYPGSPLGTTATHLDLIVANARGSAQNAAPTLDRNVESLAWRSDGSIVVGGDDHTSTVLWIVHPDGTIERVELGAVNFDGGNIGVSRDGGIVFVGSTDTYPSELYYIAPGSASPVRLTSYNAQIAALDLAPSREITWHNDGFTEYGVLTYPPGYEPGKKYPLVLLIHGGPTFESSTTSFNALVQALAAHGFAVLQPNYRGSDNAGFAYAHAIVGDSPAFVAGSDCMAAVRALIASGTIDPSRIGVSGWSAGGWLTSWLVTHSDLFKAGVTGAAVDDNVLQYSLSELDSYFPYLFGGLAPWTSRGMEAYRRNSPITYAQNAQGAILILSDTADPRVPTPESYEFYSALRDLGKTVRFIAIPAYGHHPSDPVRNQAIDRVWVDWFVKYLSPR